MSSHRLTRPSRLQIERLEDRQLMARDLGFDLSARNQEPVAPPLGEQAEVQTTLAVGRTSSAVSGLVGDVTATLLDGSLFLDETAGQEGLANGITISQLANGHILVSGHDPTGLGGGHSLINGAASAEFEVTGSLYVFLGNGDNSLKFDQSLAGFSFQGVYVAGGAGADHVSVAALKTTGDLSIGLGAGDDVAEIFTIPHYGLISIGDGNGWDALSIDTGAGADKVSISAGTRVQGIIDVHTFENASEADHDEVLFDFNVFAERDVTVATGGGADTVEFTPQAQTNQVTSGLDTLGSLTVDLGAGDDNAYFRGVRTGGDLAIYAGAGADHVTLDFQMLPDIFSGNDFLPVVNGSLVIQAYDALSDTSVDDVRIVNKATIRESLIARFAAGNDYFQLDNAEYIGNDLELTMGAGNDTADVSGFVVDHLMARLGEGNDVLHLGKTWAYRLIADGGNGLDRLTTQSNTKAQYQNLFDWELINGQTSWMDSIFGGLGGGVLAKP